MATVGWKVEHKVTPGRLATLRVGSGPMAPTQTGG